MKKILKMFMVGSLAGLMLLGTAFNSFASWRQDSVGWWWQDGSWYPTSDWQYIDGKNYYFGADGYMLHDTIQDGVQLGSDGAAVIPDIGLEVAPYKAQLDNVIASNQELYDNGSLLFDRTGEKVDCGSYYVLKDVEFYYLDFYSEYDSSCERVVVGILDELRIRKDGLYLCKLNVGSAYTEQTVEENRKKYGETDGYTYWSTEGCWLSNIEFDDKGYVIGYWLVTAS